MGKVVVDILGDICLSYYDGNVDTLEQNCTFMNKLLGRVDYRIANFEGVLEDASLNAITKDGPNLSMKPDLVDVMLKTIDVNAYSMANNHIGDFGQQGVLLTEKLFKECGKRTFGLEQEPAKYTPLSVDVRGIRIAFLSVCENEFGTAKINQIGSAGYFETELSNTIRDISTSVDKVIVLFHGGVEYYPFPTPEMKRRYRNLIDSGASAVVGMHQHCPCGYEIYEGCPICYGIGNFLFPDLSFYEGWNVGYVARLYIGQTIKLKPIPYWIKDDGDFDVVDNDKFEAFYQDISKPILDNRTLEGLLDVYIGLGGNKAEGVIKRYSSSTDNKNVAALKNLFSCESHRELAIRAYSNVLEKNDVSNADKDSFLKDLLIKAIHCKRTLDIGIVSGNNLDISSNVNVIWGLNRKAKEVYRTFRDNEAAVVVFADQSKIMNGMIVKGTEIQSPDVILSKENEGKYHICVNKIHHSDVAEKLYSAGVSKENVIFYE